MTTDTTLPTPTPDVQKLNDAREAAVSSGQSAYSGNNANLSTFAAPTITAAGISTPQTPAYVPPVIPPTGSAGLQGLVDTHNDAYTSSLAANATKAGETTASSLDSLITELANKTGVAQATDTAYKTNGVDQSHSDLNDVTNQIAAEKNALANQIASVKENKSGSFGGAVDQHVQALTDASLQRQASLAVIQSAAQGKYDIAKQIADRAVAAATEAEQNKITTLQTIYTANKDIFNTAEQEKFTADQAKRSADLQDKREQQTRISDLAITALKNGAPSSVAQKIQNAKTLAEAEGAAGSYIVTPKTGSTAAPTFGNVVASFNAYLKPGQVIPGTTTPVLQAGTKFLTRDGFQALVDYAGSNGVKRADIIAQYAPYLNPNAYADYGLTAADQAALSNVNKAAAPTSGGG